MRAEFHEGQIKSSLIKFLNEDENQQVPIKVRVMSDIPLQVSDDGIFYFEVSDAQGKINREIRKKFGDEYAEKRLIVDLQEWRFLLKRIPNKQEYFFDFKIDKFEILELTGFVGEEKEIQYKNRAFSTPKSGKEGNVFFGDQRQDSESPISQNNQPNESLELNFGEVDSFGGNNSQKSEKHDDYYNERFDETKERMTKMADFDLEEMKNIYDDPEVKEALEKRIIIMKLQGSAGYNSNRSPASSAKKVPPVSSFNPIEGKELFIEPEPQIKRANSKGRMSGIGMGVSSRTNLQAISEKRRQNELRVPDSQDSNEDFLEMIDREQEKKKGSLNPSSPPLASTSIL